MSETMTMGEAQRVWAARAREVARQPVVCRGCRAMVPRGRVVRRKRDAKVLGYSCGKCGWREGLVRLRKVGA